MDVEASAGASASASASDKAKFATASAADEAKAGKSPSLAEERSIGHGDHDILGGEKVDQVLAAKMILVNDVSFDR